MIEWEAHTKSQNFVGPEGLCLNGVMFLGEAPGANEDRTGRPFVGDAGLQLEHTLALVRELDRKHELAALRRDFGIHNVVQHRPPNNWLEGAPWEREALDAGRTEWHSYVSRCRPKVIVPVGNVPLGEVLGHKRLGISEARGYVFDVQIAGHDCYVVPTFHPSYLLRGAKNLTSVHAWDITRALRITKEGWEFSKQDYLCDPSPQEARWWANRALACLGGETYLTVDIEKWPPPKYENLTRVGFALEPGRAMTVPFTPEYFDVIRDLYENTRSPYVVFWNADFDVQELRQVGLNLKVPVLDAMWMWHFIQSDIPKWDEKAKKLKSEGKKLGFVSPFYTSLREFKSISVQDPWRNATDCDAQITCAYGMREQLKREGRWNAFCRHWVQTQPILDKIGQAGLKINLAKREELSAWYSSELARVEAKIAEAVPPGLRPVVVRRKISRDGREGSGVPPAANVGDPTKVGKREGVWTVTSDGEWAVAFPFNVGSTKQLIAYVKFRGHRVQTSYKTGRETTDKDAVETLARRYPRDPLYGLIVESRQWRKRKDQYIDGVVPAADGRVRTRLNRTPSTWRFASKSYDEHSANLQNLPSRDEHAKRYREMFEAS